MADILVRQEDMLVHLTSQHDWNLRLELAELLRAEGLECAVCGGTGGWPGLGQFVACRPCLGSGMASCTD